jgi:phosphoenolpyruvate carboxykinase (ATP)
MLDQQRERHRSTVWLVNPGWIGRPFGAGERMPIHATGTTLSASLSRALDRVELREDHGFGFQLPLIVPRVDAKLLDPRDTWYDPEKYDRKARELARKFVETFAKRFGDIADAVREAGPNR